MRPAPLQEFIHTCTLLSEQALINLRSSSGSGAAAGGGGIRRGMSGKLQQQQEGKLSLRVMAQDVKAALRGNPIYRKIIGAE